MSSDAKIRLCFDVCGERREVANIYQQNRGKYPKTVRLSLNHAQYYTEEGHPYPKIKQQYYSLHESPHSSGNLIHLTIELEDGTKRDLRHFRLESAKGLISPIACSLAADLRDPHYARRQASRKDTVLDLGAYDPKIGNIVWGFAISSPDEPVPEFTPSEMNSRSVDFDLFRVTFIWNYIGVPATPFGKRMHFGTEVGRGSERIYAESAKGYDIEFASGWMKSSFAGLHEEVVDRIRRPTFHRNFLVATTSPLPEPYVS